MLLRLIAVQVDESLGEAICGAVAYVFESASYIRRPGGSLVLIVSRSTGSMANGIVVPLPTGVKFSHFLREGTTANVRAGIVRFAGHDLSIDLRQAETYGPIVFDTEPPANLIHKILDQAYRRLETVSRRRAPEAGAMFAHAPEFRDTDALAGLIGAGPGLTPAGDDYLTGLLAATWFAGPSWDVGGELQRSLATIVEQNITRTGEVSQTILKGAIRGVFPARLVTLARELSHGGELPNINFSIDELIEFGHSSGASMAYGLINGYMDLLGSRSMRRVAA